MDGIIIIDKPKGMTSFDVVRVIKRISKEKKVGHGGTLDPLATGVLPIFIGKATKFADNSISSDKEYIVKMKLGESTTTDDSEGEILEKKAVPNLDKILLEEVLKKFTGEIEQVPPVYSAIKKNGERLYKSARKGLDVKAPPRIVSIYNIEVLELDLPFIALHVKCSKGTYIRALTRDIGVKLGSVAHVFELRRIKSGLFTLEKAKKISEICTLQDLTSMLGTASDFYDTKYSKENRSD